MKKTGFYRNNDTLFVQNLNIIEVVKKFGSPLYLYDTTLIETSYKKLSKIITPFCGNIHFAVKANDNLGIIKYLKTLGSGADVVSIGELKRCLKVGMDPKKIIFSGVGKEGYEIEFAILNNVKQINVESLEELNELILITKKLRKLVNVALRVNLDINSKTHKKISTGDENSKFGIILNDIFNAYELITNAEYINPYGLAVHVGSQIFDYDIFHQTYTKIKKLAIKLRKNGYIVNHLDLGGGFGINYKRSFELDYNAFEKALNEVFKEKEFNLSIEPGRSLVADSGILITKVIRSKSTNLKKFLIVDAAMNNLIRPTLYNAYHKIIPIIKDEKREIKKYDIVGPICETGDFLGLDINLQRMESNEYLAVMCSGAYGSVMRSNYNTRIDIPEILIHNGKELVLRKKTNIEKMIEVDSIPNFN